jgi:hypothetical protein
MLAEAHVLGATWSSLGALFAGIGALLLLIDVLTLSSALDGLTFGGGMPDTSKRLKSGMEVTGSIFIMTGSAILLFGAGGLSLLAVVIVLVLGAVLIYGVMTIRLHEYMRQIAKTNPDAVAWATWRWCATHPRGHRRAQR